MEDKKTIDVTVNEETGRAEEINLGDKAKSKGRAAWDWVKNHKTECIAIATVAIPAGVDIFKTIARKGAVKEERRLKENFVYDRSHGHHYELTRKPTAKEWRQIDCMKDSGDNLGDILDNLGLLKD